MELPSEVKAGSVKYQVREEARTATDGCYGVVIYAESLISMMPGMAFPQKRITLWHELLHVGLRAMGEYEHDEKLITGLAHFLDTIVDENPALRSMYEQEQKNTINVGDGGWLRVPPVGRTTGSDLYHNIPIRQEDTNTGIHST